MDTVFRSSFDEGFAPYDGEPLLLAPVGWKVAWLLGDKPGPVRPEIQPEIKSRGDKGVHSGENAVKLAHAYAFFDAVLYRVFAASPGTLYRALAWATAESQGGLACRVGLDPSGGENFLAQEVAWSDWYGTDDPQFAAYRWQTVAAEVIATGEQITLFLRCACRDAVQTNAGFFDDVALYAEDVAEPPPAPGPGINAYIRALEEDIADLKRYIADNQYTCLIVE